jgi:hypothetical protein
MASAIGRGWPAGVSTPHCPPSSKCKLPPTAVATIARSVDIASRIAMEWPSLRELSTNTSRWCNSMGTSRLSPSTCTYSAAPSCWMRWRSRDSVGARADEYEMRVIHALAKESNRIHQRVRVLRPRQASDHPDNRRVRRDRNAPIGRGDRSPLDIRHAVRDEIGALRRNVEVIDEEAPDLVGDAHERGRGPCRALQFAGLPARPVSLWSMLRVDASGLSPARDSRPLVPCVEVAVKQQIRAPCQMADQLRRIQAPDERSQAQPAHRRPSPGVLLRQRARLLEIEHLDGNLLLMQPRGEMHGHRFHATDGQRRHELHDVPHAPLACS